MTCLWQATPTMQLLPCSPVLAMPSTVKVMLTRQTRHCQPMLRRPRPNPGIPANVASVLCLPRTIAHRHCEPSSKGVSGCVRRVHIPLRAPRAVIIATQLSVGVPPITNLAAKFVMSPALVRAATAILRMNVLTKIWWDYVLGH